MDFYLGSSNPFGAILHDNKLLGEDCCSFSVPAPQLFIGLITRAVDTLEHYLVCCPKLLGQSVHRICICIDFKHLFRIKAIAIFYQTTLLITIISLIIGRL